MTQTTRQPMVGRTAELTVLDEALRAAGSGEGRAVLVGGEAGVGKTRLVEEFGRRTGGARVLTGGCLELGVDGLPYAPITAALRQLVRDVGTESVAAAVPDPGVLARLLPELGTAPTDTGSDIARPRLFEHLLMLLQDLGLDRPVVLVVEDAHWADASTRDLLVFLARSLQAERVLLVITYRSDELHRRHPLRPLLAELDRLRTVERLEVERLSRSETAELIRGIGACESTPPMIARVYERSGGNPLFVESLLSCADGVSTGLDDSLRDLLLRSVDALAEPTRQVLRVAAAGGVQVGHRLLTAVAGDEGNALTDALRPAVEANVLLADADGYRFRHALIREAVHDELLPGEHTSLHTAFARAIEADPTLVPADRMSIEAAHHWYAAHDAGRALVASHAAAEAAAGAAAYAEQLHMLDRVLSLWDSVPDAAERVGSEHLAVLEDAIRAADRGGDPGRGVRYATAALAEIDRAADPVRAAVVLSQRSKMRVNLGMPDATSDLDAAGELVADRPPSAQRAQVLHELVKRNSLWRVRGTETDRLAAEALADARSCGDRRLEARLLTTIACHRVQSGRAADAAELNGQAVSLAESLGDDELLVHALISESHELEGAGEHERSVARAREGVEVAQRAGFARGRGGFLAINVAEPLTSLGRWDETLSAIQRALDLDPPPKHAALLRICRAEVSIARGAAETARTDLVASGPLLRADPEPQCRVPAASREAALALLEGRPRDGLTTVLDMLEDPVSREPRYAWPMLAIGARAAADLAAAGVAEGAPADRLTAFAGQLATQGPLDEAWSATFHAEVGRATAGDAGDRWRVVVTAWETLGHPYENAYARYRLAEILIATDRGAAAGELTEAWETAHALRAAPLRDAVERLARRGNVTVGAGGDAGGHPAAGLTGRELDVIRLIAAGYSNRRIAEELFISPKTASVHVSNILTKLAVANRGEAAAAAHQLGLVGETSAN